LKGKREEARKGSAFNPLGWWRGKQEGEGEGEKAKEEGEGEQEGVLPKERLVKLAQADLRRYGERE
jgi:hypothetical protein